MTMAIRIIRSPRPTNANVHAVEREEQILAIARKVAEAGGHASAERVNECAAKLRGNSAKNTAKTPDQIADDLSSRMMTPSVSEAFLAHADIDMDRIMELLEG